MSNITKRLLEMADSDYKAFFEPLVPTVPSETIIGIRTPVLRRLARELNREEAESFMKELPHTYYEENNLHAFLIADIKDFDVCVSELVRFLPYIDNWATCDSLRPRCFKKHLEKLASLAENWLSDNGIYTKRFAIGMYLSYLLDEGFSPMYLKLLSRVESDEYYVNMMLSWYFATALAKRWEDTVPYLENGLLTPWVHNKTISKARDSFRITKDKKEYLHSLKK